MEKTIRKYGSVYRKALLSQHCREIEARTAAYEARLREIYASDGFKAHSVYPTTNAAHVYAVIAMCLEPKENLRRHVTFIRHSDLSDGDVCHDEIIQRRKSR